ncbi:hypothetical protein ACFY3U_27220 [Micromonospora sp. NPDC000089]|uniref:hypothetical protein n=1 Tax=unclassified Micromonospora TaxID=2617518 RepID=UPI0036BF01D0
MRNPFSKLAAPWTVISLAGALLAAPVSAAESAALEYIPAPIASAPAVGIADAAQNQLQVVRTADNRIFYSISNPGYPNANLGWSEIPGGGRTEYELSVYSQKEAKKTYVAATGLGGQGIWLQELNWNTGSWKATWTNHGGAFESPPEIAVNSENRMVLLGSAKYDEYKVYYQLWYTGQPVNTSDWHAWKTPLGTTKKVAARWWGHDYVLVAAVGSDRKIYNASSQPTPGTNLLKDDSWWFEVPGGGLTDYGLSMTDWSADGDPYADTFWLAARGTADGFFYQTYQAGCWSGDDYCSGTGWKQFPVQGGSPYGPSVYTLGTTTGFAGPVLAVTEQKAFGGGIAYQCTRPDVPNPPGPRSLSKLKACPAPPAPGWNRVKGSIFAVSGIGTHPEEVAAGWNPDWKDENGNPIPSPVNGPQAVQFSEPVNQWYPWCQEFINGQRVQQWMPGESQSEAFAALVQWLDLYYPLGEGNGGHFNEVNGYC